MNRERNAKLGCSLYRAYKAGPLFTETESMPVSPEIGMGRVVRRNNTKLFKLLQLIRPRQLCMNSDRPMIGKRISCNSLFDPLYHQLNSRISIRMRQHRHASR